MKSKINILTDLFWDVPLQSLGSREVGVGVSFAVSILTIAQLHWIR